MVRVNEAKKDTIGLEWTSDMISIKKDESVSRMKQTNENVD
jgi:hypothetical protein